MTDVQLALLDHSSKHSQAAERVLELKGWQLSRYSSSDSKPIPNSIRNQKYSLMSFVPKVLYQQFQYFFNMFYLLTALSQFIPALKVGLMFSFVAPLVLVLTLTMLKEGYEDYQRYLKDKEINSAEFTIVLDGYNCSVKKASELAVGDILELGSGDDVPADCLFLHSFTDKTSMFLKTDQLDGETDWKLRKCVYERKEEIEDMRIEYGDPNSNIYSFLGVTQTETDKIGLCLENTLWRGVQVAAGRGLVMVIYTGQQTKLSLNIKDTESKFGKIDEELNYLSKILFLLMLLLSGVLILLRGYYEEAFIVFFKYFLLLSSIIPISMRVNLDFAKLLYKYLIDRDPFMPNALCRNSNIPEELGRVQYILSDKTGTLTRNEMVFKKLYLSSEAKYEAADIENMAEMGQCLVEAITSLMLCHNVTAVMEDGVRTLQGSSPDELTLVIFGETLNYLLKERTENSIQIGTPQGSLPFEILEMFPFSSEFKSMGILLRNTLTRKIVYYLKGADMVMQSKISHIDASFMREACLDLAREGLRTLVMAQKTLSEDYYREWKKEYQSASAALKMRADKIKECRNKIESHMDFVGVTGVEDKLQEGVVETITAVRSIGIKVWMLTGDKVETAICVGRAVRLIQGRTEGLFVIEGIKTAQSFTEKLNQFYQVYDRTLEAIPCVLVIDGDSLTFALSEIEEQFFLLAVRMPAIICSRVTPTQKADIASLVMKYNVGEGRVLGIGDGGNDVALIQTAHMGVGIYGKEGIQAALASDFSVSKFSDLSTLIFWHGRLAYRRSSLLAQFIIHRGVIITIMQCIFIIEYYFVPIPIYNGFLLLGYSTIYTMLPVFSLIMDEDISRDVAHQYPILYLNKTYQVSIPSFTYWLFISIYQGAIIMILITTMPESFFMVTTVSFTCLILIEFLNVFTELNHIHLLQLASTLISTLIYVGSIFLMKSYLNGIELFSTSCLWMTLLIVGVAWGPPFIYQQLHRAISPSEEQKVMRISRK